MIAAMTGRKTTIRFTPATLRVVREWTSRGCDVQTIVNCGVMAWTQTDAVGREKAQLAAFAEGNTKASAIPDDEALARETVRAALPHEAENEHKSAGPDAKSPRAGRDRRTHK